jgi:hypothetical protein
MSFSISLLNNAIARINFKEFILTLKDNFFFFQKYLIRKRYFNIYEKSFSKRTWRKRSTGKSNSIFFSLHLRRFIYRNLSYMSLHSKKFIII